MILKYTQSIANPCLITYSQQKLLYIKLVQEKRGENEVWFGSENIAGPYVL